VSRPEQKEMVKLLALSFTVPAAASKASSETSYERVSSSICWIVASVIALFPLFASGAGCHQAGRELRITPPPLAD
jgi:hypothetical protein